MRSVVQRVKSAAVDVNGVRIAEIGVGLLVLVGVEGSDGAEDAAYTARKLAGLRIFEDGEGKMNRAVGDMGGAVLLVSQFTLLGDARHGRRPSFIAAARPEEANALYLQVAELLRAEGLPVQTGQFQADMQVSLVNDGPVTLLLDSKKQF